MNLGLYFHLVVRFRLFHATGQSFSCSFCSEANFKSLLYFCFLSFGHYALTCLKSQPFGEHFHKFGLHRYTFLTLLLSFSFLCKHTFSLMLRKSLLRCFSLNISSEFHFSESSSLTTYISFQSLQS